MFWSSGIHSPKLLGRAWLKLFSKNKVHHDLAPFSPPNLFSLILCLSQLKLFEVPQAWNLILLHHTLTQAGKHSHLLLANSHPSLRTQVRYPSPETCPAPLRQNACPLLHITLVFISSSAPDSLSWKNLSPYICLPSTDLLWFMMKLHPNKLIVS